ncbi:MAG: aldehyde ferredoxin oxidoreductase family protein [Spirochaetota bacterium]|nr:MAG: aldehyde ferredoxin oxidoreductase family protein [Spirochaetota bacterium]
MKFKGGYTGKVMRINLSTREYKIQELKDNEIELLLGGRGLAAKLYYDEIQPEIDPFDSENKLIFMTGPLTGVGLPSTTKFQLSTKSPETGGYLCSNCGGDFGPQLKRAGFDGLIIEGVAKHWTHITLKDNEVSFGDATQWQELSSIKTLERLKEEIDEPRSAGLSIGPAAERLVRISFINVDSRAFGRGGAGAVLGSKRLKGIAIKGTGSIPVADPERVKQIWKDAVKDLRTSRANHTKYGTPQYIEVINELGCMPTRNFQTTYFEGADDVNAHAMKARYYTKNYHCFNCSVGCGMINEVKEGPFAGTRARTEYETIALLGPNCGVKDFGAIVAANQLCDELGIDTMSGGNLVALTMELFERGLITKKDTDGIEARFGSSKAMVEILRLIGERKGIGDLLAEGIKGVLIKHPEWSPYILSVKGMPFAAYDPRGFYGNALTYGTSSRGACHNVGGWTIRDELQSGKYDRWALEGKGRLVKQIQDNRGYIDSLGICTVVRGSMDFRDDPQSDVMEAVTGYGFTPDLMEIGARVYNLERMILNREGVRRQNDQLPERIVKEKVPSGPIKGKFLTREMYNEMLDEYYRERGWDQDGIPTEETLKKLKLKDLLA